MHGLPRQEVAPASARPRALIALIALIALVRLRAPVAAWADHAMGGHDHASTELSAGLAIEAASYDNALFTGTYQGLTPSLGWMRGRFGASATISLYHVDENGRSVYGLGDAMLAGHVVVIARDTVQAGAALHVMFPTGSPDDSLGMGHTMAMPSLWASWRATRLTLTASAGYGRALATMGAGHRHGAGPLVDPMNVEEVTWSAGAELALGHGLRLGGRATGALPIGDGQARAITGGRVAWGTPRISTGVELQVGLVGDPFTVRGIVDTALRF